MRLATAALAALVSSTGCYKYSAIKPTELPKLTGPTTGLTDDGKAIAVATRTVETPDGRIIEIRGDFDVVVDLGRGDLTLEGPIHATLDADALQMKSGNRSPITAPLSQVRGVQVRQINRNALIWGSAGVVLVGALVAMVAIGASDEGSP